MFNTKTLTDFLIEEYNVSEFVGVPCSYLKYLINEVTNRGMYKSFFNEGDAVAYAVGRQIADPDHKVCILMQNSGIGNAINPITSLSEIYQVPLLMVIGDRKPVPEEPQHSIMGEISHEMLMMTFMNTEGVSIDLTNIEDEDSVLMPIDEEFKKGTVSYFIEGKDVLSPVELDESHKIKSESELTYEDVIEAFDGLRSRGKKFILVTTTGYTSRVAYNKDNPLNFYNVGAMGCAWSVANGLSKNALNLPVICIDGDGSYFMRASAAKTFENPSRCIRIILKNGCFASTGYQDLQLGTPDEGLRDKEELSALINLIEHWIESNDNWYEGAPVEIIINNNKPENLERPKESSVKLKYRLMRSLNPDKEIEEIDLLEDKGISYEIIDNNSSSYVIDSSERDPIEFCDFTIN